MKVSQGSFLTVNFYCLPHFPDASEDDYLRLHEEVVREASIIKKLRVKSEKDILNLFHRDLMSHGLGTEVRVVIENIPLRAAEHRLEFLKIVMRWVAEFFPKARKIVGEAHLEIVDKETYLIMEKH